MTASTFSLSSPLPLPRLSGNEARARSLIARHGADLTVTLAPLAGSDAEPARWRLGFTPGAPDAVQRSATLSADLEWAGARLRLGLPARRGGRNLRSQPYLARFPGKNARSRYNSKV